LKTQRLSPLEFRIMEVLWGKEDASIREILDALPGKRRAAYTTIQTTVNRMEAKGVVKRTRKIGNSHMFAATISREAAQHRLIDELLTLFGGRPQLLMAHLIETGKLSLDDVKEAEQTLHRFSEREKRI
jgi:BlaI family transcriptional regulator, penicillinase repressor